MLKRALALCLLLLLGSAAARADVILVPGDYTTIQAGIDAAVEGDTVLVAPGTYVENIDFLGKVITLQSEQGAEVTTIDGDQAGPVVTFSGTDQSHRSSSSSRPLAPTRARSDTVAEISGFTITGGLADWGGGVTVTDTSAIISDNLIIWNNSNIAGGGVYAKYSTLTLTGNQIEHNVTGHRGGGVYATRSLANIFDNDVLNNSATAIGGGIYIEDKCTAMVRSNTVTGNSSQGAGGIAVRFQCRAVVADNFVDSNNASRHGGGVAVKHDSVAVVFNNIISNNVGSRMGGGVYIRHTDDVSLWNNQILNNNSPRGGGIWFSYAGVYLHNNSVQNNWATKAGGGLMAYESSTPSLNGDSITGNSAPHGGGICAETGATIQLDGVILSGNTATEDGRGGGVSVGFSPEDVDSAVELYNSLLAGNQAGANGGALDLLSGTAAIMNSTVVGNDAVGLGDGLHVQSNGTVTATNSLFWDNGDDLAGDGSIAVSYSLVEEGASGPGIISQDPSFMDAGSGDYHLSGASPCIDAGTNDSTPTGDIERDPRPFDGDGDGSAVADIGFDERIDPAIPRMHVDGASMWFIYDEVQALYDVGVDIQLVDEIGAPVAGATVHVDMVHPNGMVRQLARKTGQDGWVTLKVRPRRGGLFWAIVTGATLTDWVYDEYSNQETIDAVLVQ